METALLAGFLITIFLSSEAKFVRSCGEIRENVVRLHIVAHSDEAEDQRLKLRVRDAVLEESELLFDGAVTGEEARRLARERLPAMEDLARRTLAEEGCEQPVRAELVRMYFDTRYYEDFSLPAGQYDAVRLTIGEGKGHNWWCVVFPPMCITAAQPPSQQLEQQILTLDDTPAYRPKLAILELLEGLRERFSPAEPHKTA